MKKWYLIPLLGILSWKGPETGFQKNLISRWQTADVDANGNLYLLDDKLNLCLYSQKTDTVRRYSVANYGSEAIIDAGNPLEVFVFFPLTGRVVIFDNQLNEQQNLNIFTGDYVQPLAFGRANDGNIWLLNQATLTLKKINRNGATISESVILKNFSPAENTGRIYDNGTSVLLQDGEGRLFRFNNNLMPEPMSAVEGRLTGISQNGFYLRKGLLSCNPLFDPASKMVCIDSAAVAPGFETICETDNWVLESRDTLLILHQRPK